MKRNKNHVQNLLKIQYNSLLAIEEQIAREGMNPPLSLVNQKAFLEEQIGELEAELDTLGEDVEHLISPEEAKNNKSLVREELKVRLRRLREFKDTAAQIREFVNQNISDPNLLIDPNLSEKFSYLYVEVATYMREILIDLGFDKKQITESIMKFITTSPNSPYHFLMDTNQGYCFIQMALHRYEIMDEN